MDWRMQRAFQFENLIRGIIRDLKLGEIEYEPDSPMHQGPDITYCNSDGLHIVECKTPGPQTSQRVREVIQQLHSFSNFAPITRGRVTKLILAIPDTLSAAATAELQEAGITVWDRAWLAENARLAGRVGEATLFQIEMEAGKPQEPTPHVADSLLARLAEISPGPDWVAYQNLCREISEFLFSPPLSQPLWERGNFSKVNRRDLILPNYALDGMWAYFRTRYQADYVVIDAKNYSGSIKKDEVLQIANYLQRHGLGLFALIFTRVEPDAQLLYILREQWVLHDKMIVILSDSDVKQMLTNKKTGTDPAELIRQKIEDFRISL
ncbi:hypothetical protein [Streptomyces sp. bgisy022]|uniref:hypothetical protein n=1 Tax=Streptomyces sp. bgisy022 TaxID=3413769 RepID=UPI003D70E988